MSPTPRNFKTKLDQIFYALAAFFGLAIGVTIYQNHLHLRQFEKVVQSNADTIVVLNESAELMLRAQQVNSPGNDVFESLDVEKELGRYQTYNQAFDTQIQKLKKLIDSHSETEADIVHHNQYVQSIEAAMVSMRQTAEDIFAHMRKKDQKQAGALMAEMDRRYGALLNAIEKIRRHLKDDQSQLLAREQIKLQASKKLEYISLLVLSFLVGIVAVYGKRMSQFVQASHSLAIRNQEIISAINATAIVATTDKNGTIIEANDNFCKVSGYTREELIGKNHRIVNSGQHSQDFFTNMWKTISSGQAWAGDITNKKKSGEFYHVRTVISPIKNADGTIEQYMSIRFDVTEQKKMEEQLLEAQTIAKIGSWKYDLIEKNQIWSSEHYRIFEIDEPQSQADLYRLYRERIHPDDQPMLDQVVERAARYGEDFVLNHRVYLDNGARIKYVRGIGKVTFGTDGQPRSISGTCQDLTETYKYQEDLRNLVDLNEAIKRSARFSIITTTVDGVITGFNDEAERILGYSRDEMIDRLTPAVFHDPEEVVAAAAEISLELGHEVPVGFETFVAKAKLGLPDERLWTYIRKDGTRIQVRLSVTALFDRDGALTGFMGIAKDMTDIISLQNQLEAERAKSLHNAKLASLGEMSAGIAHEINNPLAVLMGNIPLLSKFKDEEDRFNGKIEAMAKAAGRIDKIVKGLKKFSRTTEGSQFKVELVSEIVSDALVIVDAKSKRHFTDIKAEIDPSLKIFCDAVEIEQVLVNVINNGIDAVKEQNEKWILLKAYAEQNEAVIQVVDSGDRISTHTEQKLFQPFFTTKTVGEGTGLGLSISKGILGHHKGTINLNKNFATTCFEIRLPLANDSTQGLKNAA